MKTYHALATLVIRLFAAAMVGRVILSFLYLGLSSLVIEGSFLGAERWTGSLFYLLIGVALFRWSPQLGRFLSKGLDHE